MKTQTTSTILPLLQTLAEIDGDEWTIEDYQAYFGEEDVPLENKEVEG